MLRPQIIEVKLKYDFLLIALIFQTSITFKYFLKNNALTH